jgi:multiple sugar transport system permease protein
MTANARASGARNSNVYVPHRPWYGRIRGIYFLIAAWLVGVLGPYVWMFITSITPPTDLATTGFFPAHPTLSAFPGLLTETPFFTYLLNSIEVAVGTVVLTTSCALLAGTALSRYRFRGRGLVLAGVLFMQLFPSILLIVPLYVEFKAIGLIDNKLGLILIDTTFALAFSTWLIKGFVDQIPQEIEEAAYVDGASKWQAFIHVILPLARPGLTAAATWAFIYSWNEFLFALTFTFSNDTRTMPVGLSLFVGENLIRWEFLTAGGVLAAIPILIGFMYAQRGLIAGLSSGAVKG